MVFTSMFSVILLVVLRAQDQYLTRLAGIMAAQTMMIEWLGTWVRLITDSIGIQWV